MHYTVTLGLPVCFGATALNSIDRIRAWITGLRWQLRVERALEPPAELPADRAQRGYDLTLALALHTNATRHQRTKRCSTHAREYKLRSTTFGASGSVVLAARSASVRIVTIGCDAVETADSGSAPACDVCRSFRKVHSSAHVTVQLCFASRAHPLAQSTRRLVRPIWYVVRYCSQNIGHTGTACHVPRNGLLPESEQRTSCSV